MTLTLPSWYQGGYPDVEKLCRTLFAPLVPNVEVVSWLPKPSVYNQQLTTKEGYLRCYRTGGRINREQRRDEPKVQFAALTRNRDNSWALIEFVRQVLEDGYGLAGAAVIPGTTTNLYTTGEVVGPQLIPELISDDRLVPITFELHIAKPKGLPNYRQTLGL